jgi:membrane protein DedA with SNARE-associated domain
VPLLILISIGVVSALCWHLYMPKFGAASVGATTTTFALYQAVGYFLEGPPDLSGPLWVRAVVFVGGIALVISVAVGWPIHRQRKGRANGAL